MGCFSQGNMQMHHLFQGSIFGSWRLHVRIISKTSHPVSLSLDCGMCVPPRCCQNSSTRRCKSHSSHQPYSSNIPHHIQELLTRSSHMFWGKPAFHVLRYISSTFCVFLHMNVVCFISVSAPVQFLLTSHCCHMHETVFHEQFPIRRFTSPTYMLFHFLNLSFTICMHNHSLMLTLSITMHSHSHSLSVARWQACATLAQNLPHQESHQGNIAQS